MLLRQAGQFGSRRVLDMPGVTWTHAEAAPKVAARAGALRASGVRRGDRVAIMAGNRVEVLETVLACGWIGAVAVPVNTAVMAAQLDHVLRDSGARLLVAEAGFLERLPSPLPPSLE